MFLKNILCSPSKLEFDLFDRIYSKKYYFNIFSIFIYSDDIDYIKGDVQKHME